MWRRRPAECVRQVVEDRKQFIAVLSNGDLFAPFPWGDGQTLLREALVIIDHNSYHTGAIMTVKRLVTG